MTVSRSKKAQSKSRWASCSQSSLLTGKSSSTRARQSVQRREVSVLKSSGSWVQMRFSLYSFRLCGLTRRSMHSLLPNANWSCNLLANCLKSKSNDVASIFICYSTHANILLPSDLYYLLTCTTSQTCITSRLLTQSIESFSRSTKGSSLEEGSYIHERSIWIQNV